MSIDHNNPPEGNLPVGDHPSGQYDTTSYILVVDDDNTLLKFFKIHLNKFFSKVIVVKNAREAAQTLSEKQVDLVLCDIRMPRVNGFQMMRRIRRHDPSIPVLLISGAMLTQEQESEAALLADGFLRKPFSVDELHGFINRGMELRAQFVRLVQLIGDKKFLRPVLYGKRKVERLVEKELFDEARSLLISIKKVG